MALALRIGFALKLGDGLYQADEHGFDLPAWILAQTGSFGEPFNAHLVQPPIPSAFFAVFYWLFGHHPLAARLGQSLAGTLFVWLFSRFVAQLTDSPRAGKFALILACGYPFFIYYNAMLMSETLYLLAATAGLWWLCRGFKGLDGGLLQPMSAGAALGLAGLCRSEGVAIAGAIFLVWAALAFRQKFYPRRGLAVAVIFWVLPLIGWSARNKYHKGHWSLDEHVGTSMLHGTIVFDQNEVDTSQAMEALHGMNFWRDGQRMQEHEREKFYLRESLRFMREHPRQTVLQWRRKFVNFWRFYPRLDKPYRQTPGNNPAAGLARWVLLAASLLFEPALILAGFRGLWLLRARWRELFPLGIFLAATNAGHVISVSQMRYRLPVMPILMLGACYWAGTRLCLSPRSGSAQ